MKQWFVKIIFYDHGRGDPLKIQQLVNFANKYQLKPGDLVVIAGENMLEFMYYAEKELK